MTGTSTTTIATLTRVASMLRQHPQLAAPYIAIYPGSADTAGVNWYLHINNHFDEATQRATAREILRSIGGKWDKSVDGPVARFTQVRDGIAYDVSVVREAVCVRRVVGTETVTIAAAPGQDPQPERTETREVVEWDCGPLLGEQVSA